jgi:hypothetical protein
MSWAQIGRELGIAPQTAAKIGGRALRKIDRDQALVELYAVAVLWEEARRSVPGEGKTDARAD